MPIVAPLEDHQSEELAELAKFYDQALGFVPNSFMTLQRRPQVATAFVGLVRAVMGPGDGISGDLKRLIAAVASYAAGCRYCQAHSVEAQTRSGEAQARIENLWDWERSDLYSEAEKAAFAFAQAAASVPNGVDDAIITPLKQYWSDDEIVDILAVVSLFGFLNRWNNSMGTTLEEEPAALAQAVLGPKGWSIGRHGDD